MLIFCWEAKSFVNADTFIVVFFCKIPHITSMKFFHNHNLISQMTNFPSPIWVKNHFSYRTLPKCWLLTNDFWKKSGTDKSKWLVSSNLKEQEHAWYSFWFFRGFFWKIEIWIDTNICWKVIHCSLLRGFKKFFKCKCIYIFFAKQQNESTGNRNTTYLIFCITIENFF